MNVRFCHVVLLWAGLVLTVSVFAAPVTYDVILNGKTVEVETDDSVPFSLSVQKKVPADSDGDGILDPDDECPNDPENKCHEPVPVDTDGDGILDTDDECPNDPTNRCNEPDPTPADRDGDGIADAVDTCPDDPENKCNIAHPDDPEKQLEHMAAMDLVRRSEATVFLDGEWTSDKTNEDDIGYIDAGKTVTLSGPAVIKNLGVEGTLQLNAGTVLRVDTGIGHATAKLIIGSKENPITADNPVIVRWRDTGPLDPERDFYCLGRGFVWHGLVEINGVPVPRPKKGGSIDISKYPVRFESENWQDIDRRGHFMLMHKPGQYISGLLCYRMGRTDKEFPVTDPVLGDMETRNNPRGRYPWHFHLGGLEVPSFVYGSAVVDSPGWGLTVHGSNVRIEGYAASFIKGAGLVAETGIEAGWFKDFYISDITGSERRVEVEQGGREIPGLKDDWAVNGHGVWVQGGGNVLIKHGVIERCAADGLVVMGLGFESLLMPLKYVDPAFPNLRNSNMTYPWGGPFIRPGDIPVRIEDVDISECDLVYKKNYGRGLVIWSNCNPSWHNYERGLVKDVRLDKCFALSGYSNRTTYVNLTAIGDINNPIPSAAFGHTGRTFDIELINPIFTGWDIGYQAPTDGTNLVRLDPGVGRLQNIINIIVTNKINPDRPPGRTLDIQIPKECIFELPEGVDVTRPVNFNGPLPIVHGRYDVCLVPVHIWFDIRNTTQPNPWWPNLFDASKTFFVPDRITYNGRRLVYEEWCRDYKLPGMIPAEIRDKYPTSGELYDETGAALFQRVPVNGEPSVPLIHGRYYDDPVHVLDSPVVPSFDTAL